MHAFYQLGKNYSHNIFIALFSILHICIPKKQDILRIQRQLFKLIQLNNPRPLKLYHFPKLYIF